MFCEINLYAVIIYPMTVQIVGKLFIWSEWTRLCWAAESTIQLPVERKQGFASLFNYDSIEIARQRHHCRSLSL